MFRTLEGHNPNPHRGWKHWPCAVGGQAGSQGGARGNRPVGETDSEIGFDRIEVVPTLPGTPSLARRKSRAFYFFTDFHNSFESHPSRKPLSSANLNPTVSTLRPSASRKLFPASEFLRPLPRSVKHPQDFHCLAPHPVGHDVRSSRNHQLSRPCNSSRPAHGWILLKKIHGSHNP